MCRGEFELERQDMIERRKRPRRPLPGCLLFHDHLVASLQAAQRGDGGLAVFYFAADGNSAREIQDIASELATRFAYLRAACCIDQTAVAAVADHRFVADEALDFAAQILAEVSGSLKLSGAGVAVYPETAQDPDGLLAAAALAAEQAAKAGRGDRALPLAAAPDVSKIGILAAEAGAAANHPLMELEDLELALQRGQLRLHYQPQIEVSSGRVIGAEALVRLCSDSGTLELPGSIIPAAEATGTITRIGEWVLETACAQAADWANQGLPPVSCAVNLSLAQVQQESQVARIVEIVNKSGVKPCQIEIELTETADPSDTDEVCRRLKPILDLGMHLALDDLGTGYATLSLLRRLPVGKVKIDRSFVAGLGQAGDGIEDLRAIVEMGQGLGLTVLAEGVERAEQYDTLRALGCDSYQGYYFSPALPAPELAALIARNQSN